VILSNG